MTAGLLNLASWILIVAGSILCVIGALGLLRMPDLFTRMHAASLVDTLGAASLLLGMILQAGFTLVTAKLIAIGLLLFFTGPTATHALARAARARGVEPLLIDKSERFSADDSATDQSSSERVDGGQRHP
ncbi:MAG: sodium:proton antiporter [Burkholderiales bacterium]|nr:sodium:proton antiporter [Burkholderiales bacterium]